MPPRAPEPCRVPGCSGTSNDGYCPEHTTSKYAYDHDRGNAAKRGFDHRWRTWRIGYLKRHPLCVDCSRHGIVRLARDLHHVKKLIYFPDLKYSEENILGLCQSCHSVRTSRGE